MERAEQILPPGTTIEDNYRVVRLIGRGGMGAVYEAVDTRSGVAVAVKVLDARYLRVPEIVKRFHREAKLAAAIGHDNICEVIDVGTLERATPYLVMPLLAGEPLSRILKTKASSLTKARVARIVTQTLAGLAAAHHAGIIHRDLKPDNIFITAKDGERDFVKLLDFGVSKMVASGTGSIFTKEGTLLGTPAYMAPEQARGSRSIDHRIDIYAMGVILYEIMTGRRPYTGATPKKILFKIIAEPFLSPRRVNEEISEAMENVIIKAMAKDPHGRYASVEEMQEAFNQAAGVQCVLPARETSAPTMATVTGDAVPEPPPPPKPPPPTRKATGLWLAIILLLLFSISLSVWLLISAREEPPVVVPLSPPAPSDRL
jgi:serine/threonine-protein kinase